MASFEELKQRFPTCKHPPKPDCRKCKGEGMFTHPKTGDRIHPCMCIFVDHDVVDLAMDALADTARQILNDPQAKKEVVDSTLQAVRQLQGRKTQNGLQEERKKLVLGYGEGGP